MKVLDPGHKYELESFDGGEPIVLTFVKRNDPPEKYPGNEDAYPGTQIQEVLRALIERCLYVDQQIPCDETKLATQMLRRIIWAFESRHARQHGQHLGVSINGIERLITCPACGHIICFCKVTEATPPSAADAGA